MPDLASPAIPFRPERAEGTRRAGVIDAFLMRAADDPVGHGHGSNAVFLEEENDLFKNRSILAHITLVHEIAPEICRGIVLFRDHRGGQLGGSAIVWTVEGNGADRKAAKAPLGLLAKPLIQLLCSARRHHGHGTWFPE